jgi:hypothetical protein
MTVTEVFEQAKALTPQERKELMKLLVDILDVETPVAPKTGAEIVAMLEALPEPIGLVDDHIEDPVEWVKAQRQKRQDTLKPYWDGKA